ncbi:MAG: molybdenum cofactor guanylyltransferase [Gemmatimonadaceae bacterium]
MGVILAGGGATRFGGKPKGLELVDGVRIIDRVAAALRGAADELLLIANDPGADAWLAGVRTAADVRRGEGALGGLHAALSHADGHAVLVVAWDMPYASEGLLRALRAAGERGYEAVVPESETSGRGVEPLCAWYAPSCLPAIERCLDAGDRRVVSFFADVRVAHLPAAEVSQYGDPARIFFNVNRPDDLPLSSQP